MSDVERVAVLGFGVTGRSVVMHLLDLGLIPVIFDTRPQQHLDDEFADLFADVEVHWNTDRWLDVDVARAVVSPGLSLNSCLVQGAKQAGVQLQSDIDLFFAAARAPVIGITGTNGKSTVTALVGHLLAAANLNVGVGGNLGEAALSLLAADRDVYVLELSSFQLERSRLHRYAATTILNITEDHLDQHGSFARYAASKRRIHEHTELIVYDRGDGHELPTKPPASSVSFALDAPVGDRDWGLQSKDGEQWFVCGSTFISPVATVRLQGEHNRLNVMAACALAQALLPPLADTSAWFTAALGAFQGLKHRFETLAQVAGVTYVNDSKATNLGAALAALEGLPAANNVLLLAGGDAKGVDLSPLRPAMRDRVKFAVAIGRDRQLILDIAAQLHIDHQACESIEDAVAACAHKAEAGDLVLLSPACASIDMFHNYAERGDRFAKSVQRLVEIDAEAQS